MKKNLILSLCMLLGVTACKKESKNTAPAVIKSNFSSTFNHDALAPTYVDLNLNADGSYTGIWNNCAIRVTGTPGYDQAKYPTLVNGIPVTGMYFSTWDGVSTIDYANTGTGGAVFQVTQDVASLSTFQFSGFYSDLTDFFSDYESYVESGGTGVGPSISNDLQDTYTVVNSGQPTVHIYTGKLIRVTTGSHLALATLSYPVPAGSQVSNTGSLLINDPNHTQDNYSVYFSSNIITKAVHNTVTLKASGTSIHTPGTGIYHLTGTIIRSDGTEFKFEVNQDFS